MVIADLLRERLDRQRAERLAREEARLKRLRIEKRRREMQLRDAGRAMERAKWMAWNTRRLEAEETGQRFDEPPPLD